MARYKQYWRANERIHAPKVRVIDEKGKQVGVLSQYKALEMAQKKGLDLVEIAPKAKPPVTKIINFGKFKYHEEKKLRRQRKGVKGGELKEVRFSPFIGRADYDTRIQRIKEFLEEKDKVRVVVKFKGRQMGSKQFGYNLLKRVLDIFDDQVSIDMEPKFLGRHLMMVISPTVKSKKQEEKGNSKKKNAKTEN
ncbi:MAG: translation initiation factor IF-3 [Patescibacteria group bacterium]